MSEAELISILDDCMRRLQAGETLEDVLARHSQYAAELRPLLEVAAQMRSSRQATIPTAAQSRSRAVFLTRAAALRAPAPRRVFFGLLPRAVGVTLLALVVVISSLFSGGLVSAQSLPGDSFYPVKIAVEQARLWLTLAPDNRLRLEEDFDLRRSQEVARLLKVGRAQPVSFAGFLAAADVNAWQVAGIPLAAAPSMALSLNTLNGSYVEVQGVTTAEGRVQAEVLRLRVFHLDGRLDEAKDSVWKISGVPVELSSATLVRGQPALGKSVRITALRLQQDRLAAMIIEFGDYATPTAALKQGKTAPQETQSPLETAVPNAEPPAGGTDGEAVTVVPSNEPGGQEQQPAETQPPQSGGDGESSTPASGG